MEPAELASDITVDANANCVFAIAAANDPNDDNVENPNNGDLD